MILDILYEYMEFRNQHLFKSRKTMLYKMCFNSNFTIYTASFIIIRPSMTMIFDLRRINIFFTFTQEINNFELK